MVCNVGLHELWEQSMLETQWTMMQSTDWIWVLPNLRKPHWKTPFGIWDQEHPNLWVLPNLCKPARKTPPSLLWTAVINWNPLGRCSDRGLAPTVISLVKKVRVICPAAAAAPAIQVRLRSWNDQTHYAPVHPGAGQLDIHECWSRTFPVVRQHQKGWQKTWKWRHGEPQGAWRMRRLKDATAPQI